MLPSLIPPFTENLMQTLDKVSMAALHLMLKLEMNVEECLKP